MFMADRQTSRSQYFEFIIAKLIGSVDNIYIGNEENGEIYFFALLDDCIYDIEKIKRCSGAFLYQGERKNFG